MLPRVVVYREKRHGKRCYFACSSRAGTVDIGGLVSTRRTVVGSLGDETAVGCSEAYPLDRLAVSIASGTVVAGAVVVLVVVVADVVYEMNSCFPYQTSYSKKRVVVAVVGGTDDLHKDTNLISQSSPESQTAESLEHYVLV